MRNVASEKRRKVVMEERIFWLKTPDQCVQSRIYTDTFIGEPYRLDMEGKLDATAPMRRKECRLRAVSIEQAESAENKARWAALAEDF